MTAFNHPSFRLRARTQVQTTILLWTGLLLCSLLLANADARAQSSSTQAQGSDRIVGTLVYFEGAVSVTGESTPWENAAIDDSLRASQKIRTSASGTAEIQWKTGQRTVLGPDVVQSVDSLFAASQKKASGASQSLLQGFRDLFTADAEGAENEAGGVRRSDAKSDLPATGDLYWKRYETVDYEDASKAYQDENYAEAAKKLHLFLQQNPEHSKTAKARFALGHAYVELNNPVQARKTFETLVQKNSDDPLADRARKVVEGL